MTSIPTQLIETHEKMLNDAYREDRRYTIRNARHVWNRQIDCTYEIFFLTKLEMQS